MPSYLSLLVLIPMGHLFATSQSIQLQPPPIESHSESLDELDKTVWWRAHTGVPPGEIILSYNEQIQRTWQLDLELAGVVHDEKRRRIQERVPETEGKRKLEGTQGLRIEKRRQINRRKAEREGVE